MSDPRFEYVLVLAALTIIAYLLGSIPWGVVLTRAFSSVDIRRQGSGNIGATNVSRTAGSALGVLTFSGDLLKGALSAYLAFIFAGEYPYRWSADLMMAIVALAAFLGHLYPLFMGFKDGGKGVATCAGCFAVLAPLACLSALLTFMVVAVASKRISAGSLAAAALLPWAVWFFTDSSPVTASAAIMSIYIFLRHIDNIKRLFGGTEPMFRQKR